jgi:prepilin-type N-terminal cleavage/methylation domain-containing protein
MVKTSGCMMRGHGFTLIEIVLVVAIIGIIAAIAIPSYYSYIDKARMTVSISVIDSLGKDLEAYYNEHQEYPATVDFTNFTDQNGNSILLSLDVSALNKKMFSWDSYAYVASDLTYTVTAKAIDSKHTVLTLTREGVKK